MSTVRCSFVLGLALTALACSHSAAGSGVGSTAGADTSAHEPRIIASTDRPVLFLGAEPDAPVFGFVASDTEVVVSGPSERGRVPVRIDGAIRVKAFVPEELLALRAQRRGRVRGTPTYVGPNDLLSPMGATGADGRVHVRVVPRLGGRPLGVFEGTYPLAGLSAQKAAVGTEAPAPGTPHELPAGRALPLFDAPGGVHVADVPAQPGNTRIDVIANEQGWLAVRVGDGPYLIGYTHEALAPVGNGEAPSKSGADRHGVPKQLTNESGALKRVAPGTRISFNEQVVAVFKSEGWARVLAEYPEGQVDVFAAVDDGVAVRGLVPKSALRDVSEPHSDVFDEPSSRLAPMEPEPVASPAPAAAAPAPELPDTRQQKRESSALQFGLAPLAPPVLPSASPGQ
jgi:hypothetical protein